MKNKILIIAIGLSVQFAIAQSIERQVIGASGSTLTDGTTATIDFTVGEVATTTLTDGTTTLAQGFHQGELILAITVNPIVFLQGAYLNPNTGEESLMRDDLRVGNYVPTATPYTDGLTCDASVFTITGNNAIVDWVWVELRDENDNTFVIASQSALLQRDGDIVGVDGVSELSFNQSSASYYLAINHRNHLGIISASAVALTSSTIVVDLSSDPIAILGGTNAVTDMGSGIYAMYGGDFDEDGQILNTDINGVLLLTGTSGYLNGDSDLNGQILNTDIQLIIQPNSGKGQQY